MNALAVVFRLLSLFSLVGLVAFVWLQWETEKAQKNAFLDEQVSNGYSILQSTKEAQWKDISEKNSKFKEVFLDNQPVGLNDENPLENALTELKTSENAIMRGKDYRDKLDDLAMEFGAGTFFWNSEKKSWEPNPAVKPEGIAALKDPFSDESKFPKEDIKKEDGTVIPAVPRENRLRTVMGMLYKDRNDLYGDIASLRSNIVERDQQLRESQNLFNDMKTQKEEWEAKSNDFELLRKSTETKSVNCNAKSNWLMTPATDGESTRCLPSSKAVPKHWTQMSPRRSILLTNNRPALLNFPIQSRRIQPSLP